MKWLKSRSICLWLALVLALTLAPGPAAAANKYWVGPVDGSWWDSQNWSSSLGGPGGASYPWAGDNVLVTSGAGVSFTNPPFLAFAPELGFIIIDAPGGGVGPTIRQESTYFSLQATEMVVGHQGNGGFTQYSGWNNIKFNLYLGALAGSAGVYRLYNGLLQAPNQVIGFGGYGLFDHVSGDNQVGNSLILASGASSFGNYILHAGKLEVKNVGTGGLNGEFVGMGGAGQFLQWGGVNKTPVLGLGVLENSKGYYALTDGSLTTNYTLIGSYKPEKAQGDFYQTGGLHKILAINGLQVQRGTYTLEGGTLTSPHENISGSPDDTIDNAPRLKQTGGVNSVVALNIGGLFGSGPGVYLLSGTGSLSATSVQVGIDSAGIFNQKGGTHNISSDLVLGYSTKGDGTYFMTGGVLKAVWEYIGKDGKGYFYQGGTFDPITNKLDTSYNKVSVLGIGSQGTYIQDKWSFLEAGKINVAPGGKFNKTGSDFQAGSINNAGQMILGGSGPSAVSGRTDNLPGGLIHINGNPASFGGEVLNQGTFRVTETNVSFAGPYTEKGAYISDGATQTFTSLRVDPDGFLTAGPNSRWLFSQDLDIRSTRSSEWNTLAAELSFIPGSLTSDVILPTYHLLTVPGQDLGPTTAGFQNNFAWGRLVLNDEQIVFLQDGDGTPGGALYVREIAGLSFDEGNHWTTNLFSNGLNLYYDPLNPANDYLAGQRFFLAGAGYLEPAVPLPATWLLLGSGLLGLAGWRRFRKN